MPIREIAHKNLIFRDFPQENAFVFMQLHRKNLVFAGILYEISPISRHMDFAGSHINCSKFRR